ncbi:MAG: ribonuclease HI family protein [Candidatus Nealsonbacteria bacterium]|nr:ribonuclease HI family protein [Candidatus Nealsonbacteria bacterium]
MDKIIVYTDGGSRGNPGPSAIGAIINGRGYAEFIGDGTNNEAEYKAVIFALKKSKALFGKERIKEAEVELRSDSELLVRQLNGEYKISEPRIQQLFIEVWNLKIDFGKVKFILIPREKNKQADRLVNEILDNKAKTQTLF